MTFALRDYQETAVVDVRMAFRLYRLILLVLSTGAGKTVIFSYIARSSAAKNKRVLILAHRDQLIKQASRKLNDYGARHGIIMAGYTPDHAARIQVASVQTLVRRLDKIRFEPDLIVIDEAHLSAATSYRKILDRFPNAKVLGVTGSPCRLDNKPLGKDHGGVYEYMVTGISIRQLIERGFLVRPVVYAPAEQIDLSGLKSKDMRGGDYAPEVIAEIVDKPKLIGDAADQYQKICPGKPAVAWCVTVQHAQHVADEFNARGITAVMLCGEHDGAYRDDTLRKLATGEVKVVTFVGILVEGVDVPEIAAILLLRPTMSLASYLQVIGRGLRPAEGKDCCYVLDHAGLSFKHGLADEEREWSLDWGEKKKKGKAKAKEATVDVIQCQKCYAVFSPDAGKLAATKRTMADPAFKGECCCPNCGEEVKRKGRKLDQQDGELQEITPEMAERMRKQKKREVNSARTLEDLLRIAAQRGYSSGWAHQVHASRTRKLEKEQAAILAARIEKMITAFDRLGVTVEMLEGYLKHDVKLADEKELETLTTVYNKIKTGTPVSEFFTVDGEDKPVF